MTDKELLELAAKAAGYEIGDVILRNGGEAIWRMDSQEHGAGALWNPLTDDGDALRLAVKLGLDINVYPSSKEVGAVKHHQSAEYSRYFAQVENDDWYSATRRAIVRAAAEIGKTL